VKEMREDKISHGNKNSAKETQKNAGNTRDEVNGNDADSFV